METDRQNRNRRRSTVDAIRMSITSISDSVKNQLRSHWVSTIALCSCMFCMCYLLISPFPYSGFMAMDLVEGLNHENAGSYAGVISASFMAGRALSAFPWGKIADIYGRRFVLISSLILSSIFSLAFGLSPTYFWALVFRFLLGLSNGLMATVKTSVSELARGDHELEARGMGLVVSTFGYSMLFSPAISGALSEPLTQHPNINWFNGHYRRILSKFPFILPNIIGSVLCIFSAILVSLCVEETLPEKKRRDANLILSDGCSFLTKSMNQIISWFQTISASQAIISINQEESAEQNQVGVGNEVIHREDSREDFKILNMQNANELSALLSSRSSRASYSSALRRPSLISVTEESELAPLSSLSPRPSYDPVSSEKPATRTISSFMSNKSTREHLIAYWLHSFVSVCTEEAFPLFCMSKEGGLGISESIIGEILSCSGLFYVVAQYFVFALSMKYLGLHNTMVLGITLGTAFTIFYPVSISLNHGMSDGTLTWSAFTFVAVVTAIRCVFNATFYAGVSIGINRSVDAEHRGQVNGFSSIGGSIGRAMGPVFSGFLVSFCISSGTFPPHLGAVVVFLVLEIISMAAIYLTCILPNDEKAV